MRGLGKGIDGGAGALGGLLGNDAEDGDGDSRCAKDDELCDAAAIEQVDGELHQDARGIGCSRTGGKLGVILECQRKGVVSGGAQQAEPEECEAPQNLERKRARGGLDLGQPQDGDGDGGADNCLRLAFVLRVLKQRSVSDKADHAGAKDKALCEHNALGTGEQSDVDVEAKLGGKEGEGEERECQKRVDFRLAQVQGRSFGRTERSCPRL